MISDLIVGLCFHGRGGEAVVPLSSGSGVRVELVYK